MSERGQNSGRINYDGRTARASLAAAIGATLNWESPAAINAVIGPEVIVCDEEVSKGDRLQVLDPSLAEERDAQIEIETSGDLVYDAADPAIHEDIV